MVNAQDEGAGVLVHLKPHREDVRFKGLDAQPMAYWRVLWCPGPPEARQDEGEHIQIRLMPSMMSSSWWIASRFQIKGADLEYEQDVAVRTSRSLVHSELSSDMYDVRARIRVIREYLFYQYVASLCAQMRAVTGVRQGGRVVRLYDVRGIAYYYYTRVESTRVWMSCGQNYVLLVLQQYQLILQLVVLLPPSSMHSTSAYAYA